MAALPLILILVGTLSAIAAAPTFLVWLGKAFTERLYGIRGRKSTLIGRINKGLATNLEELADKGLQNNILEDLRLKGDIRTPCYPDLGLPAFVGGEELNTPAGFFFHKEAIIPNDMKALAMKYAEYHKLKLESIKQIEEVNAFGEATSSIRKTKNAVLKTLRFQIDAYINNIQDIEAEVASRRRGIGDEAVAYSGADITNAKAILKSLKDKKDELAVLEQAIQDAKITEAVLTNWLYGVYTDESYEKEYLILRRALGAASQSAIDTDKTLHMARAYPTFKLWFIEKDANEWLFFDDFYSYGAVQSIEIVDSYNSASQTAIIRLSNVTGVLTDMTTDGLRKENPLREGTTEEQNIDSLMLRVGCPIRVKMGYSNNPDELDIVFEGAIAEIKPGEVVNIVAQSWGAELTYPIGTGPPLRINNYAGWNWYKHIGRFFSPAMDYGDIVTRILNEVPGLVNFGKWSPYITDEDKRRNVTRFTHIASWFLPHLNLNNPRDDNIYLSYSKWRNATYAQDKYQKYIGELHEGEHIKDFQVNWLVSNQTAWGAIQEVLLYNPNTIAKVLPFDGDHYSTLYVGPRDGYYKWTDKYQSDTKDTTERRQKEIQSEVTKVYNQLFRIVNRFSYSFADRVNMVKWIIDHPSVLNGAVDFSSFNMDEVQKAYNALVTDEDWTQRVTGEEDKVKQEYRFSHYLLPAKIQRIDTALERARSLIKQGLPSIKFDENFENVREDINTITDNYIQGEFESTKLFVDSKQYKPVCSHHFIDSYHHIIANNIQASSLEMYNKVVMSYPPDPIDNTNKKTLQVEMVADDNIKPDYIRMYHTYQKNIDPRWGEKIFNLIETKEEVKRRGQNAKPALSRKWTVINNVLKNVMEPMYTGELVLVGNPKIKSHDYIYLFDRYNDMIGPIFVRQVVHHFTPNMGYVTTVTPGLVCYPQDFRSVQTISGMHEALGITAWSSFGGALLGLATMGSIGSLFGVGMVAGGLMAACNFFVAGANTWNKTTGWLLARQPIILSGLWYRGKPYVAGVEGMRRDNVWVHMGDKIYRYYEAFTEIGKLPYELLPPER